MRIRAKIAVMLAVIVAGITVGFWVYEIWWNDFSGMNHYEVLRVRKDATTTEIKRAFRELSLKYHPDKSTGSELNVHRFHHISHAYEVLGNSVSRAQYDQQLGEEALTRKTLNDRNPWNTKLIPSSLSWMDVLRFYIFEFPIVLFSMGRSVLDWRFVVMGVVYLGCIVFFFDMMTRLFGMIVNMINPQFVIANPARDTALRAARMRQQEALDATARMTRRRRYQINPRSDGQ